MNRADAGILVLLRILLNEVVTGRKRDISMELAEPKRENIIYRKDGVYCILSSGYRTTDYPNGLISSEDGRRIQVIYANERWLSAACLRRDVCRQYVMDNASTMATYDLAGNSHTQ